MMMDKMKQYSKADKMKKAVKEKVKAKVKAKMSAKKKKEC